MITSRERLHQLVDRLPADQLDAARRALDQVVAADPVLHALLTAPEDDEPLTDADRAALEEARADIAAGRLIPHEQVKRELSERR
ncbi:MAG TPA: hypothetical protein VNL16_13735 [Chloroflexota bacterium]|nr:hypothetical protein [Chloroflexota bacterium]